MNIKQRDEKFLLLFLEYDTDVEEFFANSYEIYLIEPRRGEYLSERVEGLVQKVMQI